MTLEEIKKRKIELEKKFSDLIEEYQEVTNTWISKIEFEPSKKTEFAIDAPEPIYTVMATPTVKMEVTIIG